MRKMKENTWKKLLTGGLGWLVALVWAKYKPDPGRDRLEQRISELEAQLEQGEVGA